MGNTKKFVCSQFDFAGNGLFDATLTKKK